MTEFGIDVYASATPAAETARRIEALASLAARFTEGWRSSAACGPNQIPARWFEVPAEEDTRSHTIRQARQVCARCPVKIECLSDAMTTEHGMIAAGTTPKMRHRAKSGRQSLGWLLDWARRETVEQVWPPTRATSREEWVA